MKTTVEISDALLQEARQVARADGTTLRELVETGLRAALLTRRRAGSFRLRDASVGGSGLSRGFRGMSGTAILDAAYGADSGAEGAGTTAA